MKKPVKKGVRFDVVYASGRQDSFYAKNSAHYDMCKKDLEDAVKIGAVKVWRELSPQAQKETGRGKNSFEN